MDAHPTSTISDLPSEILLCIFEYVLESQSLNHVLPALMVCQRWNELCSSFIWKNVVVSTSKINRFATCTGGAFTDWNVSSRAPAREKTFRLVQNISIKVVPIMRQGTFDDGFPMFLGEIPAPDYLPEWLKSELARQTSSTRSCYIGLWKFASFVLPRCTNLKTFSIRMDHPNYENPHARRASFEFSSRLLRELLASLPDSCTSLEFDIIGETEPLCCTLRSLLPRLHHLRLSLGHICPAIVLPSYRCSHAQNLVPFEGHLKAPNLKAFTISLRPRPSAGSFFNGSRILNSEESNSIRSFDHKSSQKQASQLLHTLIRHALQVAHHRKVFPDINILEVTNVVEDHYDDCSFLTYSRATVNSGLETRTSALTAFDNGSEVIMMELPKSDEIFFADWESLSQYAEGESWVTTLSGSRFPMSFKTSNGGKRSRYDWDPLKFDDMSIFYPPDSDLAKSPPPSCRKRLLPIIESLPDVGDEPNIAEFIRKQEIQHLNEC